MSSFSNRPNTALLVIDVQKGVVAGAHQRDEVIGNIGTLVDKARAEDVPVIWVQHTSDELPQGSEQWQYVDELQRDGVGAAGPQALRRLVRGHRPRVRAGGARGVGRLVVTGAQTDACVRSTLHGAFTRGYDTVLVGDAHTTEDLSEWGAPPPGQGDRPHQPVLVVAVGAGPDGRRRRHRRRQLRRP